MELLRIVRDGEPIWAIVVGGILSFAVLGFGQPTVETALIALAFLPLGGCAFICLAEIAVFFLKDDQP